MAENKKYLVKHNASETTFSVYAYGKSMIPDSYLFKTVDKVNLGGTIFGKDELINIEFDKYTILSTAAAISKDIEFPVHVLSEDKHTYTVLVNGDVTIHGLRIPSMSKVELCKVHFTIKETDS